MKPEDRDHLALAMALTFVAGAVDAIGFLKIGGLFVSFMSGDTTRFSVALGRGEWNEARRGAGIVALFVLGAASGRMLEDWAGPWRRPVVIVVELGLLGLAASPAPLGAAVAVPLVLAMGVQNSAVHKAGEARMSLTYVTGALVTLGQKLVEAARAVEPGARWAWLPYLLLWCGLACGAAAGAYAFDRLRILALLIPIAILAVLAVTTAVIAARGRPADASRGVRA